MEGSYDCEDGVLLYTVCAKCGEESCMEYYGHAIYLSELDVITCEDTTFYRQQCACGEHFGIVLDGSGNASLSGEEVGYDENGNEVDTDDASCVRIVKTVSCDNDCGYYFVEEWTLASSGDGVKNWSITTTYYFGDLYLGVGYDSYSEKQ